MKKQRDASVAENGNRVSSGSIDLMTLDSPELAATYEEVSDGQFEHGKQLISDLEVRAGERVLDIGTGTGRLAAYVAEIVGPSGRVIGIDPLPLRIEIAKTKQTANFEARVGQAEDLSEFADASFDVVYLNSVFHWVTEKLRALAEISRALKPGGRVGLNCHDATRPNESRLFIQRALVESGVQADYRVVHPSLGLSSAALQALLAAAGFVSCVIETRTLVDVFRDVDALIAWSSSSTFGNFLVGVSAPDRVAVRNTLVRTLESKATPEGIRLERYLLFATARNLRGHSDRAYNSLLVPTRNATGGRHDHTSSKA
jgi:SAM-dependent methyltransferase